MKSRILSDTDHKHEIYFTFKDYEMLYKNYKTNEYKYEENPYGLILCAKAAYLKKEYPDCLDILKKIRPDHSTKILYERQALIIKALYLNKPEAQDQLQAELKVYEKFKNKCPGRALTAFHDSSLRDLLAVAQKQLECSENIAEPERQEMRLDIKKAVSKNKFQGLPSYLFSTEWNQRYSKFIKDSGPHPGPITNFEIINHIFEFEPHYQRNKQYMDTILFPTSETIDYIVTDRKHWKCISKYFPVNPIKRVFIKERRYKEVDGSDTLIKMLIECENVDYFMHWQKGCYWERSVLPLLMNIFGPGQLKEKTRNDEYLVVQPGKLEQPGDKLRYVKVDENMIKAIGESEMARKKKIYMQFDVERYSPEDSETKGIVGLNNLGNTCYMNSALQCLSHITDFSFYFLRNDYLKNLNISDTNKDGSYGEVTCALADIFKRLWFCSKNTRYIDPRPFKRVFGNRFMDFDGYDQQDAQEFLMFLMNCLHDDLNENSQMRISYRESMSGKGFEQIRNTNLSFYNRHNKSIIGNLFHGFHYEEIVCETCSTSVYKFEDNLMHHLQVPPDSPKIIVYYVSYDTPNCEADKVSIFMNKINIIGDIAEVLCEHFELSEGETLVPLMFDLECNSECWKFLEMNKPIKQIERLINNKDKQDHYLFFHKIPKLSQNEQLYLLYYLYEDDSKRELTTDGYPRLLRGDASLKEKDKKDELYDFVASSIIKSFQDKKDLIKEVKYKKIKAKQCHNALKVESTRPLANFTNTLYKKTLGESEVNKEISLYDCLNKMREPQNILVEQGWHCDKCSGIRAALKTDKIYCIGQVLIIQLKRFTQRGKITTKIFYPVNDLDMSEYVDEKSSSANYQLKGVVLHRGSLNSGHYTSYCKNGINNTWYSYDDEYVREIEESYVVDSNAYILIYERSELVVK